MKKLIAAGLLYVWLTAVILAQTDPLGEASRLETQGQFQRLAAVLHAAIDSKTSSPANLAQLEFELDRLGRIKKDYSFTREEMFSAVHTAVRDVTQSEFDEWVREAWFDIREIDGTLFFFKDSVSNLFYRHPELNSRRINAKNKREQELLTWTTVTSIKQAALAKNKPYVLPKTFHINMAVTAASNAAVAGEVIRAWIPIPRETPFQSGFKLLSSSVPPKAIAAADSPIRSIYFEQTAHAGAPTEFGLEYEYTIQGVHFDLQPEKIQPYNANDDAVKRFTGEAPHVVFTPEIKALSASIVGAETNPMLKAKRIFDWQSGHLQYSYALEYSTLRNISDYCRSHGYGDCGQQALLFITLCRYNGVPARWQTGWNLFPGDTTIHDWAEIYLAPYGWVPVDPYMGNYAMRYITTLTPAQKTEIRDFYFGGLDQYRMIANSDHDQQLDPPKKSFRSDDVDFQRGELEHAGKNIYFDQFSYSLNYKILPPPSLP